jgi:hypothetical protein
MMEVPPSSDRNQRANIVVDTEDKFNKWYKILYNGTHLSHVII